MRKTHFNITRSGVFIAVMLSVLVLWDVTVWCCAKFATFRQNFTLS